MGFSDFLNNIFPKRWFKSLQTFYHTLNKKLNDPINKEQFIGLLESLNIKEGSVLFIHSSLNKINFNFSTIELLDILISQVGNNGTVLFPSWSYIGRTETFANNPQSVFDINKSYTSMGILPELARRHKKSKRSLHPTTSVCAIGKLADELLNEHHLSEYACDEKSPFFKMMKYQAKIIGLGEKTTSLSFVHCVEDIMKNDFPIKVYFPYKHKINVVDKKNNNRLFDVYVHLPQKQNIPFFIKKYINKNTCRDFKINGFNFFIADSVKLYNEMYELAKKGITIYQ